ncbi:unnamed protein product [Closterium sp. NIES-54]
MTLRPSFVPLRVPLPAPPASSLPEVPNPVFDLARAAGPTASRHLATAVNDRSFESSAASTLVAELLNFAAACRLDYATALVAESGLPFLCPSRGDPDVPDIPTPHSYAEAIMGPYFSQWQAAMDAEMASWKSTGTYVEEVPQLWANIVDGMWIFRVKRPPGSPPAFKAHYVARGFSQRQGVDFFQTFSPTPKMTTLRVLLHVASQRFCSTGTTAACLDLRLLRREGSASRPSTRSYRGHVGTGVASRVGVLTSTLGFCSPIWRCCEAEIYAGAMAAQELCWLTYLLTDLGEQPRSPLVLYVDNKAMTALC